MGYTTEFEGRFDCYRAAVPEIGDFLKAIYQGDRALKGPLADWLQDRGDPRGELVAGLLATNAEDDLAFWRLFGLKPEHEAYLRAFAKTRRMARDEVKAAHLADSIRERVGLPIGKQGAYFVGGGQGFGRDRDDSILDYNLPPRGQPGLWCQWHPTADGTGLSWNGAEKFYHYVEWLEYLIRHFLAPWGYFVNGAIAWQGEEDVDQGTITIKDNHVSADGWGSLA